MTAKRREKIKQLGASLPLPEIYGDPAGDVLLIAWGSTFGPVREAVSRLRTEGIKIGHLQLRHIHPLPGGLAESIQRYREILVVEMNDEGLYGYGQLAMLLRARYANPAIRSITKTDGLTFKVREISDSVLRHMAFGRLQDVPTAKPQA
jgi:2-oxoglutarate ferredoxin oxidoreductase subunit alpha